MADTPPLDPRVLARMADLADLGLQTASLVHDLRQPLFAARGHVQLLQARMGAQAPELQTALEQLDRLNDLIEFYRGVGSDEESTLIDLNDPVRAALHMLSHRTAQIGATVELSLYQGPMPVRARPGAVQQVAANLLQNAVDAVADTSSPRFAVHTELCNRHVRLRVRDWGVGVPQEMLGRVFEPFVTSKSAARGTGLGLYIAKQFADSAQGQIRLSSPQDGGTLVELELPLAS